MSTREDERAVAWGYKAMYLEAMAALLRIANECGTKDEMEQAAKEALDLLGVE